MQEDPPPPLSQTATIPWAGKLVADIGISFSDWSLQVLHWHQKGKVKRHIKTPVSFMTFFLELESTHQVFIVEQRLLTDLRVP